MNKPFTQQPVIPKGWTGKLKDFNSWQKSLQTNIDKVRNTNIAQKLSA